MSRPSRIPDRGDVAPCVVASRLGLTLPEFQARRSELERRGFPEPDETTGRYCIEVASRLGLTLPEFQARRSELERRGFPEPDETTGRYCIEAVDRWRLQRHPRLGSLRKEQDLVASVVSHS